MILGFLTLLPSTGILHTQTRARTHACTNTTSQSNKLQRSRIPVDPRMGETDPMNHCVGRVPWKGKSDVCTCLLQRVEKQEEGSCEHSKCSLTCVISRLHYIGQVVHALCNTRGELSEGEQSRIQTGAKLPRPTHGRKHAHETALRFIFFHTETHIQIGISTAAYDAEHVYSEKGQRIPL